MQGWELAKGYDYEDQGKVEVADGCLVLRQANRPQVSAGPARFRVRTTKWSWRASASPATTSSAACRSRSGEGSLTLILGGWGGSVVRPVVR